MRTVLGDTLHKKSHPVFWRKKIEKKYFRMSSAVLFFFTQNTNRLPVLTGQLACVIILFQIIFQSIANQVIVNPHTTCYIPYTRELIAPLV